MKLIYPETFEFFCDTPYDRKVVITFKSDVKITNLILLEYFINHPIYVYVDGHYCGSGWR